MGDDLVPPLGQTWVSDEEDADHLVPPVTPPGLAPDGVGEWDFSTRLAAGAVSRTSSQGSGRHPQPTRHASLDAGYLQQRLYAAAHAVLPGSSGAPHQQGGALGGVDKGSRGVHSAAPNDGIEIAWVSNSLLHTSATPGFDPVASCLSHTCPTTCAGSLQVWPPCLANDTGPVEFAVNVAPREWLNGGCVCGRLAGHMLSNVVGGSTSLAPSTDTLIYNTWPQASTPTAACPAGQSAACPCTSPVESSCCRWSSWTFVGPQKSGAGLCCVMPHQL